MKLRIKSMTWNIRKQKTTMQTTRKKELKEMRIVLTASGTTSGGLTFASLGFQKEKKMSKKSEIYLKN